MLQIPVLEFLVSMLRLLFISVCKARVDMSSWTIADIIHQRLKKVTWPVENLDDV